MRKRCLKLLSRLMQRKLFLTSLALVSLLPGLALSQTKQKLSVKKEQLNRLRGSIRLYEKKIAESNRKESVSLGLVDRLERQNLQTRQMIKRISDRVDANSREISGIEGKINAASSRLDFLKSQYARFARSFYENGREHDLELILTAQSLNEMIVRYEYLKKFSDQIRTDLISIDQQEAQLVSLRLKLQRQLGEQREYLHRKSGEENKLSSQIREHRYAISVLRRNKKVYADQLKRSRVAAVELEKLIESLVAEEANKKTPLPEAGATARNENARAEISGSLSELKGHLPWPVTSGRVVERFGEQENPILRTVTMSYGIDIAVPDNAQVKSVADGVVSRIFWLPSYGNLIIIDNYHGLRTVYSHLSDIFVKEGETVKEGQMIGTVGQSLQGSILHFEVWLNKDKQDPEAWLSRK